MKHWVRSRINRDIKRKIQMRGLGLSFLLLLGACQSSHRSTDKKALPVVASESRRMQSASVPLDPLKEKYLQDLSLACRNHNQIKDQNLKESTCACVVRNHRERLEAAEIKSLVRKYRAGSKNLAPADADESMLWDYDLKLAEECVGNSDFTVQEEP